MEMTATFVKKSLAQQVMQHLRETIEAGEMPKGLGFPSSRHLARKYGVSHNIMLKVLRQLHDEDILYLQSKRRGYQLNMKALHR